MLHVKPKKSFSIESLYTLYRVYLDGERAISAPKDRVIRHHRHGFIKKSRCTWKLAQTLEDLFGS